MTQLVGQIVEVEIERIVPGGRGLGHAVGLTLFVGLSAAGDLVRVRIDEVRGRVGFATVVEVVTPGAGRVAPLCPHFGVCGGCDWQHLTYTAQLAAKGELLADCLRRIAGLTPPDDIDIVRSPAEWGYRSRAVWRLDPARRLGYYELGSHRVCDVEVCPVLTPKLQDELTRTRQHLGTRDRRPREMRVAAIVGDFASEPRLPGAVDELSCVIRGEHYAFDATCFFQTNLTILAVLVEHVIGMAAGANEAAREDSWLLDLYCGVGLFTLPLARRFARVVGVEGSRRAVEFARRNLARAGLRNAMVAGADVGAWLAGHRATRPAPDVVVLDPPRTGMAADALTELIAWRPPRVIYVSCDPATLARDLRSFVGAGYEVRSVTGFDMFPQTHHLETVATLALERQPEADECGNVGVTRRGCSRVHLGLESQVVPPTPTIGTAAQPSSAPSVCL